MAQQSGTPSLVFWSPTGWEGILNTNVLWEDQKIDIGLSGVPCLVCR